MIKRKKWTETQLQDLMCDVERGTPMPIMKKKYKRNPGAIKYKIDDLGLKYDYRANSDYLSVNEVADILNVKRQTIGLWIKNNGLKPIINGKYRLISDDNLLKFLRKNQNLWCASRVRKEYFEDLDWFQQKLESEDDNFLKLHTLNRWSKLDEQRLIMYIQSGKSHQWIADRLGKSKKSVSMKIYYMKVSGK